MSRHFLIQMKVTVLQTTEMKLNWRTRLRGLIWWIKIRNKTRLLEKTKLSWRLKGLIWWMISRNETRPPEKPEGGIVWYKNRTLTRRRTLGLRRSFPKRPILYKTSSISATDWVYQTSSMKSAEETSLSTSWAALYSKLGPLRPIWNQVCPS